MLGVTWLAWDHEHQSTRTALHSQFDFALRDTVSQIEQRATAYEQMLRGVQALFATTSLRDRDAVRHYIETLQLDANFSGIRVIGVIEQVPAAEKSTHIANMRRLGVTDYRIHPEGDRVSYTPIIQRVPHLADNHAPLGLDTWADPVRRLGLEKARDSGMAAITGKVRLAVDQAAEISPGFIMYLPIFSQGQAATVLLSAGHI